jgi:hypothetical protein
MMAKMKLARAPVQSQTVCDLQAENNNPAFVTTISFFNAIT